MQKVFYLPTTDIGKAEWIENFSSKLSGHASALGISAGTVTDVEKDSANFGAMVTYQHNLKEYGTQVTAFKNILRDGGTLSVLTDPPIFVEPGTLVSGIFERVVKLVQVIKNNANYTVAIGEDLGIIGSDIVPDYNSLKPILKYELKTGHPNIVWTKGIADAIKFKVDRGTGTYEFLAIDSIPDYLDTHALPPLGQSAIWKYVAVYMHHDEEVGNWSEPLSVTVTGQP